MQIRMESIINGTKGSMGNSKVKHSKKQLEDITYWFGKDSLSALILEGYKNYFICESSNGYVAFEVLKKVAICLGDPICDVDKWPQITNQFREYCKRKSLKICFSSISEEYAECLKDMNFNLSFYGKEAQLDLLTYQLAGKKKEKLRGKMMRAEKAGIRVEEYCPKEKRDLKLEKEIEILSNEWFKGKNPSMTFAFGNLNFDDPGQRKYYTARDNNRLCVILTFLPFDRGEGYFLDIMRRSNHSVPGAMEKTIISAVMDMKEQGVRTVSLGVAPLSDMEKKEKRNFLEKIFYCIYCYGECDYNFKSLYQFKQKFDPSYWKARYVGYEKGVSPIRIALSLAKVRSIEKISLKTIITIFHLLKAGKNK